MPATIVVLVLIAFVDPQQGQEPPTKTELEAITERGRNLAGYDAAAWHGSDAVQAANPKQGSIVCYIARKTDKGWVVAFGRMSKAGDKFLIAYEATQQKKPEDFKIQAFETPKEDTGFYRSAAKAIDVALRDFTEHFAGPQRPYNVAVVPAEKDEFWVYLVPAPTKPGIWPLGGDTRYLVSADGSKIVSKRQLHKSIIEKEAPDDNPDAKLAMGIHTHVLAELPEDTDVFHVLTRKPAVPEMIATQKFVYIVEAGGAIKYLGTADEVLKK